MYVVPVATTFLTVSIVIVALRLYTRLYFIRTPGWDDLVIFIALLSDVGCFIFIMLEVRYGLGESTDSYSPEVLQAQLKALWASIPLYNLSLNLTKVSLVLLYLRLFPLKGYRIVLVIVLIFVVISGLWMIFATLFMCIPIRGAWDPSIPRRCIPNSILWSLNAALQITSDIIIVILPMPLLAKLQLPRRQKIALIAVFAFGVFGCAMSLARLTVLVKRIKRPDRTKYNAAAANWSFIEANVAIICACLPLLRPIIVHLCPRIFLSQNRSQSDKPPLNASDTVNPFRFPNHSYSASVTGNCSTNNDGRESSTHRHPDAEGIQVVSEIHLDLNSAENAEETGSLRGLQPSGRNLSLSHA
ncbi:hypothetical protein BDV28DRAFT_150926 [Aspergillus coremiiformis]|uniref:Rhodopsin domain-containing protein n=1 Tax=Aspergillus coremiiformis TaxID=138285 RepID=A0A5N6Z0H9_9EURO|nr:hypothetical protein BDV28DRAFT_150926 [Aspergillus coremiiformis]